MDTSEKNFGPLIGRIFLSSIFIMSGIHKLTAWSETAERMQSEGMLYVPWLLTGAILFELGGGLLILLGLWTRLGATLLIIFLIPTTLIFHDFCAYEGTEKQTQMINFMKNTAIFGGLCYVAVYGAGSVSFDNRGENPVDSTQTEVARSS